MGFLWDQWAALGSPGHPSGRPVPFAVDPEALLLASLAFAMDESRFRNGVLDWLKRHGALISVQRMKNLQRERALAPVERVRAVAAFMQEAGHPTWKALNAGDGAMADDIFSENSGRAMSGPPEPARPAAFLVRMRLLLGVTARAEVVTWLLAHGGGHAARIARDTGWFAKSVQAILNDLEQAGMLTSRIDGKRREYAVHPDARLWHPNFGAGVRWIGQAALYAGVLHVFGALDAAARPGLSPEARAIAIRRPLEAAEAELRAAGVEAIRPGTSAMKGVDLVQEFEAGTARLLEKLEARFAAVTSARPDVSAP